MMVEYNVSESASSGLHWKNNGEVASRHYVNACSKPPLSPELLHRLFPRLPSQIIQSLRRSTLPDILRTVNHTCPYCAVDDSRVLQRVISEAQYGVA